MGSLIMPITWLLPWLLIVTDNTEYIEQIIMNIYEAVVSPQQAEQTKLKYLLERGFLSKIICSKIIYLGGYSKIIHTLARIFQVGKSRISFLLLDY